MNTRLMAFVICGLFFLPVSCIKTDTPTPAPSPTPTPTEEQLSISMDPDPGSSISAATGPTYDFKINITKYPSAGVVLSINTKKSIDNTLVQEASKIIDPYTSGTVITLGGLVSGVLYEVSVNVTSKSKSSNNASTTFKLSRK